MGLILDTQEKNAKVKTPKIKAIKSSPLPTLQPADDSSITGAPTTEAPVSASPVIAQPQPVLPQEPQPITPEPPPQPIVSPEPLEEQKTGDPSLDFYPVAPVGIPKKADPTITPTASIWQDVNQQPDSQGQFSINVANTKLPSFSVQLPGSGVGSALSGLNQTIGQFNQSKEAEAYAAAQAAQKQAASRTSLPNTPEADKRWSASPVGILGDILFGTAKAKKQSEAGQFNPLAGSYGRAGAGIGGEINYALGVVPSLFVGAIAEANKAIVSGVRGLGVSKENAEKFARDGFLGFLPDKIPVPGTHLESHNGIAAQAPNTFDIAGIKPSNILHMDFDDANTKNYLQEALVGNPLTDVNEPVGSTKYGRVYTRTQRKEGSHYGDDPVGFAIQFGTMLFSPGEIPGDLATGFAIHKLVSMFKKPVVKAAEQGGAIVLHGARKSAAQLAEEELAKNAGNIRAGVEFSRETSKTTPSSLFNLDKITEEQTRRLQNGTPMLEGQEQINRPLLYGQTEVNPPLLSSTGKISTVENEAQELNPPRLDYGDAYIEYPANVNQLASAQPTTVPRVYNGTNSIAEQKLPPVFTADEVPDASYVPLLPPGSPSTIATQIGIGAPGIRVELPGAIVARPLSQVLAKMSEVAPNLVDDFSGVTWADFKSHLSAKVPDISAYNAVGQDLLTSVSPEKESSLATDFLNARTTKDQQQIDNSFTYATNLKQTVTSPTQRDAINQFFVRDIYDTPEAANVIKGKLQELGIPEDKFTELIPILQRSFKGDEEAKEQFTLEFRHLFKGKMDAWNKFKTGDFWKTPEIESLVKKKFSGFTTPAEKASVSRKESIGGALALETPAKEAERISSIPEPLKLLRSLTHEVDMTKGLDPSMVPYLQELKETLKHFGEFTQAGSVQEFLNTKPNALRSKFKTDFKDVIPEVEQKIQQLKDLRENFLLKDDEDLGSIIVPKQAPVNIPVPKVELSDLAYEKRPTLTEDDLLTAAEELALHKQTIAKPLEQLDSLFNDTVDFGRKTLDEPYQKLYNAQEVHQAAVNNGKLNLLGGGSEKNRFNSALANNLPDLENLSNTVANAHNSIIEQQSKVAALVPEKGTTIQAPPTLFHGSGLKDWQPPSNLAANGSRGELGHGTYYTTEATTAKDYAMARTGENVNPTTFDYDVQPTVYGADNTFVNTLDANTKLSANVRKELLSSLPAEVNKQVAAVIKGKKKLSFVNFKESVEAGMAKAGVEPTERLLTQVDATVSNTLRRLGYDSIYHKESGFLLGLDNSNISIKALETFENPSAIEAAKARYNADSLAAKHFPKHLTTDANLRDSTYKLLSQVTQQTDNHLAEVQQKLIESISPAPDSILPKLAEDNKPESFVEAMDEINASQEDFCDV